MDDVIRVLLIIFAMLIALFLLVVGLLMWRHRIPPKGLMALGLAGFYLLTPIDVIPEAIVGPAGLVDDAGLVGVAVLFALRVARARKVLRDSGVDFTRKPRARAPRTP